MLCINSENSDPCFNLAAEEYLLKCFREDLFLLYRNDPAIVIGKHQNAMAEINLPFVREKGIMVVRRISGGGTVYHDPGNLNFAFITNGHEGNLVDYRKFTEPVIGALGELGLDVRLGKRNELLLDGRKISGTASHVYKQRVLHHGTLLFSSRMEDLSEALRVQSDAFESRAVKSVPSRVTNIRDHLVDKMDVTDFQNHILGYILRSMEGAVPYALNKKDLGAINGLRESRFTKWEWNFGYSPKYQYNRELTFGSGKVSLHMNVERGIIRELNIEGDFMSRKNIRELEQALTGSIHDPETLRLRLSTVHVDDYISGLGNEELLAGLFY